MFHKAEEILIGTIYVLFVLALIFIICENIYNPWIITLLSFKGFELPLLDTRTILLALLIPVFVTIFSLIPAAKALKKTDLIDIVEGVNF